MPTRHPEAHPAGSSLLQLPHPYGVPGGRFGELYYWASCFTMLGRAADGRKQLVGEMLENFTYLIDTYGHVPDGTRSYYLGRSQPSMFALKVELAQAQGVAEAIDHLLQLRQEHAWWMRGEQGRPVGQACQRVVRLPDGWLLNRYWDDRDAPREESWLEDVTTVRHARRELAEVYRDLRAACESGWDFSTRWLRASAPETDSGRLQPSISELRHSVPRHAISSAPRGPMMLDADLAMITVGMAWWYRAYSREQTAQERGQYEFAETEAKAKHIGLWRDEESVAPWDGRKAQCGG